MNHKEFKDWLSNNGPLNLLPQFQIPIRAKTNLIEGEPVNGCATYSIESFTYTVGDKSWTLKEDDDWTEVKEYIERYDKGEQANLTPGE